ncbi:MAG: hypothetical protein U0414_08120 [Polyangiaceae bacterium]
MAPARRFIHRALRLTVGLVAAAFVLAAAAPAVDAKPSKTKQTAKAKTKKKSSKVASSKGAPSKKTGKKAPAKDTSTKKSGGSSHAVFDADYDSTPAAKYGALDKAGCLKEARARNIGFDEVEEAAGVLVPVRLTGPLNGVSYHTELPEKDRGSSPYEVFDCRLVLALHDFSAILTARGIDEAYIFSAWRPPGKDWPSGKEATRHPGGLAVDIRVLKKASGGSSTGTDDLVVARDWTPARDEPPCGDASGEGRQGHPRHGRRARDPRDLLQGRE